MPKANSTFWRQKLARTAERDATVDRELAVRGWRVLRLWEHEIEESAANAAERVAAAFAH